MLKRFFVAYLMVSCMHTHVLAMGDSKESKAATVEEVATVKNDTSLAYVEDEEPVSEELKKKMQDALSAFGIDPQKYELRYCCQSMWPGDKKIICSSRGECDWIKSPNEDIIYLNKYSYRDYWGKDCVTWQCYATVAEFLKTESGTKIVESEIAELLFNKLWEKKLYGVIKAAIFYHIILQGHQGFKKRLKKLLELLAEKQYGMNFYFGWFDDSSGLVIEAHFNNEKPLSKTFGGITPIKDKDKEASIQQMMDLAREMGIACWRICELPSVKEVIDRGLGATTFVISPALDEKSLQQMVDNFNNCSFF